MSLGLSSLLRTLDTGHTCVDPIEKVGAQWHREHTKCWALASDLCAASANAESPNRPARLASCGPWARTGHASLKPPSSNPSSAHSLTAKLSCGTLRLWHDCVWVCSHRNEASDSTLSVADRSLAPAWFRLRAQCQCPNPPGARHWAQQQHLSKKGKLPPHMNTNGHMRTQHEKCIGNFRHFQNLANSSLGATRAGLAAQGLDTWSPNAATGHRTQPGNPPNETCQVNGGMHLLPQRVGRRFRHVPSPSHISTPTKNHSMRRCGKQLLS